MLSFLTALSTGLAIACAVLGWVFVMLYSRVHWWKSPEGKHLMRFTTALALTFSLVVVFRVVRPDPLTGRALAVFLYGWIATELAVRVGLLLRARRETKAR